MPDIKHVGRLKTTGRKVLVAFRTLPGDAYSALVIDTASLPDELHNALIQLVEGPAAQQSFELHEVLARSKFPDGSTMLPALHVQGKLLKVPTSQVEMIPNFQTSINLAELNQIIAEQRGISVSDLAIQNPNQTPSNVEVQEVAQVRDISPSSKTTSQTVNGEPDVAALNPVEQAEFYRKEADRLMAQVREFQQRAESLAPTVTAVAEPVVSAPAPAKKSKPTKESAGGQ